MKTFLKYLSVLTIPKAGKHLVSFRGIGDEMKTKLQIKSYLGNVLFEYEAESIKEILERAVKERAYLQEADLREANLQGADLRRANLWRADLQGADLLEANLRGADLLEANLRGADLRGAILRRADLRGADLQEADLREADLRGAILRGAKNIPDRYFELCRDDFWAVLSSSPMEINGLRKAIIEGKIDGSHYEGECACLVGTIANVKGCKYDAMPNLKPDSSRLSEVFFSNIEPNDTPQNNEFSKRVLGWLDEWMSNMKEAFSN